jgi:hypothetical protein
MTLSLEEDWLAIGTVHLLESMSDFEKRAVGAGTIEHGGNDVLFTLRGGPERGERFVDLGLVAGGTEVAEATPLHFRRLIAHREDLKVPGILVHEVIYPHDDP